MYVYIYLYTYIYTSVCKQEHIRMSIYMWYNSSKRGTLWN